MKIQKCIKSAFFGTLIVVAVNLFSPTSSGTGPADATICGSEAYVIDFGPNGTSWWACHLTGYSYNYINPPEWPWPTDGWYTLIDRDHCFLFYWDGVTHCSYSCTPFAAHGYVNPPIT